MRFLLAFVLAALVATSGCLGVGGADGDDDRSAGGSPPPAASPAPDASPTPTPPAEEPTPTPPTEEPSAAAPPREVVNESFDFSQGDATGKSPHAVPFEVPEGYAALEVRLVVTPRDVGGNPVSIGTGAEVALLGPDGAEVKVWDAGETGEVVETLPAGPGAWTVEFRGAGSSAASLRIVATA